MRTTLDVGAALTCLAGLWLATACESAESCGGPTSDFPFCGPGGPTFNVGDGGTVDTTGGTTGGTTGSTGSNTGNGGTSGGQPSEDTDGLFGSNSADAGADALPPDLCDVASSCGDATAEIAPDAGTELFGDGVNIKLSQASVHWDETQPEQVLVWLASPSDGAWLHVLAHGSTSGELIMPGDYGGAEGDAAGKLEIAAGDCTQQHPLAEGLVLTLHIASFSAQDGLVGALQLESEDASSTIALELAPLCPNP